MEGVVVLLGDVDEALGWSSGGRIGVCTVSVPYWELSGQVTGALVPRPICAGVQMPSPCAAEGESVMPRGR